MLQTTPPATTSAGGAKSVAPGADQGVPRSSSEGVTTAPAHGASAESESGVRGVASPPNAIEVASANPASAGKSTATASDADVPASNGATGAPAEGDHASAVHDTAAATASDSPTASGDSVDADGGPVDAAGVADRVDPATSAATEGASASDAAIDETTVNSSADASGDDATSTGGEPIASGEDSAGGAPLRDAAEEDLPPTAADRAPDAGARSGGDHAQPSPEESPGANPSAPNRQTIDGPAADSGVTTTASTEATTDSDDPGADGGFADGGSNAKDPTAEDSPPGAEHATGEETELARDLDLDAEVPWIELPEVDLVPLGRGRTDGSPMREIIDHSTQLRGAWRQLDPSDNAPDFGPGGFDECMIGIDSASGVLQLYRSWGRPPELVVAAHFLAEFAGDGTLRLAADPQRPHLFSETSVTIGGAIIVPPGESLDIPRRWRLVSPGELEIDGRRYARADRATFERLTRAATPAARSPLSSGSATATTVRPMVEDERRAIDFFGTSVKGRRVCFVVDRSGSMSEGFKMQAALRELDRCIRSLPPDREFFVLFFDEGKLVVEDRWISADPATARFFLDRLPGVQTGGGTNPHDALAHAFRELRPVPDELHLMTDGLIPFQVVELLRELNSGNARTVIHTYAFTNQEGEAILRQVADDHGGTYRFVP